MTGTQIGTNVHDVSARNLYDAVLHAEAAGIPAFWLTTGAGPDALTVLAAAAPATRQIALGTSIVPTFPRNPVVVAQQALDIATLSDSRFTLGLGPSHGNTMLTRYGVPYERPLEHLREFVTIVRGLLRGEEVRFVGNRFRLEAKLARGAAVPVITSALRVNAFELAGEIADGAVSWLCPARYLRDVATPALARGAERGGRARPPLIGQVFLALTTVESELHAAVARSLAHYPRWPNYQEMFAAAGLPEARGGEWTASMIDATVIHGDPERCERQLDAFIAMAGCERLVVSVLAAGADPGAAVRHSLDWIGEYCARRA